MVKYVFILILAAGVFFGCKENIQSPDTPDNITLNKNSNYTVHLSGQNEVPPVSTLAQGEAIFRLNKEGTELYYKLIVANLTNLFMAHIHVAPPGVNGGVAVWLYPDAPPAGTPPPSWKPGRFSGVLAEGVITSDDLVGPLAGMTLADLIENFNNSTAYVNVHTNDFVDPVNTGPGDFPGGEIRGNIGQ